MSELTAREQMLEVKALIEEKQYAKAREMLLHIQHPKASEWLTKLETLELGDPFVLHQVPIQDGRPIQYIAKPEKSYTNAAVIVLILYFFLWIPGLIANLMYIADSVQEEDKVKHALPGANVLKMELIVFVLVPIIAFAILAILIPFLNQSADGVFQNIISAL